MSDFVRRLTGYQKREYARLVGEFLARVRIEGVEGLVPTEDERQAIAGSCAILFVARPEWPFPPARRVVVSPWPLVREGMACRATPEGKHAGVHIPGDAYGESEVWIHRKALETSVQYPTDGYHVGVHEFTHALDADGGPTDGAPSHIPTALVAPWLEMIERARATAGQPGSPIEAYGGQHARETFAMAVEEFFERPEALQRGAPELYAKLVWLFQQDPAVADRRERVLVLSEAAMAFLPADAGRGRSMPLGERARVVRRLQNHVPGATVEECERAIRDVVALRGRWSPETR
ncbi:MAG: zinc-dependent peptidase [Planctomycetota bacterium]